jgi:hypothetical protein
MYMIQKETAALRDLLLYNETDYKYRWYVSEK